jgi:CBS domain-containing protein
MTTGASPNPELAQTRVEDVMHRGLVTCSPDTPLRKVAAILAAHRIHAVVVADRHAQAEHDVWGVVSDLDVVAHLARAHGDATAGAAAAAPPCVVVPSEPLSHAARLMATLGVAHVLVVDPADRRPVGVVSTLDVANAVSP